MVDVLVPLDGSPLSERVLPAAATLARAAGGQLRMVEAINLPAGEDFIGSLDDVQAASSDYLEERAEAARRTYGLAVSTVSQFGPPAAIILHEAASGGVRYVAMTSHARHGFSRAVLGSVAEHVLRESLVPVYLLPAAAEGGNLAVIKHMLLPLDGSALSQAVLEPAAALAREVGARMTLVRVYEPPSGPFQDEHGVMRTVDQEIDHIQVRAEHYLAPLVGRLHALGVQADSSVDLDADPAGDVLRLADSAGCDLIVMATHGRSGLDRLRHGSVTEQVLRRSHVPLLAFGRVPLHELAPAQTRVVRVGVTAPGVLSAGS